MPKILKFLLEVLPLLVFFICYKLFGIITATISLIFFSFITIFFHYVYEKQISKTVLFSNLLVIILGLITVISNDGKFIKMKPTILYLFFAAILTASCYLKKPIMKNIFQGSIFLEDKIWLIFSARSALFFVFLALCNEIIWRNFSESFWVKFKVFGTLPLFIIFFLLQYKFLSRNSSNKP